MLKDKIGKNSITKKRLKKPKLIRLIHKTRDSGH